MSPSAAVPGWYRDGVTAGCLRWFDGTAWTEHTVPDAQPPAPWQPPQAPYAAHSSTLPRAPWDVAAVASADHGPSSAVHWMLPVGRSWQSIVAGYLGLLALGIWLLGPLAIGFGVWALVRANDGGHGRGRAIIGIVGGAVGTLVLVAFAANAAGTA